MIRNVKLSCMILAYHIPQNFAKLPDVLFRPIRAIRLYEQGLGELCDSTQLGKYVKRWVRWAGAGLGNIDSEIHGPRKEGLSVQCRVGTGTNSLTRPLRCAGILCR